MPREVIMNWFGGKRVIVPVDFSDESKSAVEVAQKLAKNQEHIHVIHVIPNLLPSDAGIVWENIDPEERKDNARAEITKWLSDIDTESMHVDVGIGDAGHVIVDLADEVEAGLIVIPSHGRTGLTRVVMGSVAERVVRHARCPVLVLKSKAPNKK